MLVAVNGLGILDISEAVSAHKLSYFLLENGVSAADVDRNLFVAQLEDLAHVGDNVLHGGVAHDSGDGNDVEVRQAGEDAFCVINAAICINEVLARILELLWTVLNHMFES